MEMAILDIFDIGEDRSVLLVGTDGDHSDLFGEYDLVVDGQAIDQVVVDGKNPHTKDETGKSVFVTTTKKLDLKETLKSHSKCFLKSRALNETVD